MQRQNPFLPLYRKSVRKLLVLILKFFKTTWRALVEFEIEMFGWYMYYNKTLIYSFPLYNSDWSLTICLFSFFLSIWLVGLLQFWRCQPFLSCKHLVPRASQLSDRPGAGSSLSTILMLLCGLTGPKTAESSCTWWPDCYTDMSFCQFQQSSRCQILLQKYVSRILGAINPMSQFRPSSKKKSPKCRCRLGSPIVLCYKVPISCESGLSKWWNNSWNLEPSDSAFLYPVWTYIFPHPSSPSPS